MPRPTSFCWFHLTAVGTLLLISIYAQGQSPQISGLTPTSGAVGTQVSITGANFGSNQGTSTVSFNGTSATPGSWSNSSIAVQVPPGATTGNVVVTVGGVTSNGVSFTVLNPGFTPTGSLTTARMFHTATILNSGGVLVVGGVDGFTWNPISSAEVYNPATGVFSATGSLNAARIFNTATLLPNGTVMIAGGTDNNWNNIAAGELYDPASGAFAYIGALNDPRNSHTATLLNSGMVLIAGGVDSNGDYITSFAAGGELYDPATRIFTATGNLNASRDGHTATLLNSGQVLIVGGLDINGNVLASAELYDPTSGTFTTTGNLNFARAVHTAALLNNGMVLIAGGYDNNGNAVASAELYDPVTASFIVTSNMNIPRYDGPWPAALLNDGSVLIAGGQDTNGNTLVSGELFDPVSGAFTVAGNMSTTRQSLTTTLLNNGQVLAAGGMDFYGNVLASAELYQPSSVFPAGLVSIVLTPGNQSVSAGGSLPLAALGTFNDGRTQILGSLTWSSSDTTIAMVSNDVTNHGTVFGVAGGIVTVSACASSLCGSTFISVTPSITSLSPTSGAVGSSVTISGVGFGSTQGSNTVTFNGITATTISGWSASQIVTTVPDGAGNGIVVVTVGGVSSTGASFTVTPQGYGNSYQNGRAIVLSHTRVFNTDQTDFPVLISGVYSFLATVSNGGQVLNSNGYDIIFCADPQCTSQLDHEIDTYNPVTGAVNFWVRIPTLSHSNDTTIYTLFGNPSVTTSQENKTGVWRNNYLSVYHLGNGSVLGLSDSGAAGYSLSGSAAAVPGQIGGGAGFSGDPGTYLFYSAVNAYPSGTSPVTIEAWFQFASSAGVNEIVGYGDNSGTGARAALYWDGSSGYLEFENIAVSGPLSFDSKWHHMVGVYGGGALSTTTTQLYVDGSVISNTSSGGTPSITATQLKIGGIPTVPYCCAMNGSVDEVRVSLGTRTADWIATEYANQSSPWTFYTVDTVGGASTPAIASLSPAAGGGNTQVAIQGSNFGSAQGTSTLTFNGVPPASIVSWSNGQIVAVAPSSVTTGPVIVVVGSVQSNTNVVFTANNPLITSLSPPIAPLGSHVVINGYGFGGGGNVSFNGAPCNIQSWSATAISVVVPDAATTGPVTVTTNGVTSNGVEFTVEPPPSISTISPSSGPAGTVVTINGSNFGSTQSNSTVAFGGAAASEVYSWSDNEIVAVVPQTSTSPVTVTVAGMNAQGPVFTVYNVGVLTNSLGYQTTYTSAMVGGRWVLLEAGGPGCSSCSIRNNFQNTYDSNGNVLTRTDANGNTITYTYDSNSNILSESAQLNGAAVTTSYTYNSFGEVLTMTDALGNTTTNTYDGHGNLLSVTSPAPNSQTPGSVTQFAYNNVGELTQITDPLGHSTNIQYYSTGLIQSITDAQNNTTSYTYDARGNRTSVIDPINGSAHPTTFSYDIMNRLLGITYPNGTSVSFTYDYRGRRISATDQNNNTTTYVYDDADRLVSVTDAASHSTAYNYDSENNLTSITDANNHTTYFTYDALGRLTQTTFPSTLVETYGYDLVGNLTSKTDRKGQKIEYVYDSLYRLTNKVYPDSTTANYVYDLVAKILQVTDPTGTYGFAYDNMGRVIGTTTQYSFLPGVNIQNSYTYDAASNRRSMTAPDGSTSTYNYDTLNRLNTLTSSLTGQFGFSYDALNRRTQLARPNGINTNYSYDSVSNLLSVLHQSRSTTLDGSSYGYDNAGNRTTNTNYLIGNASNYGYDALYELPGVTGATNESYTYDAVGNRLSSASVSSCSYNSSNQLVSSSAGSYTYDPNGNTLTDAAGKQYTWDFENRLTQVIVPGTGSVTFKYDPFGRRIYKSSPIFAGLFAYDDYNLIETMNSAGAVLARYTMTQNIDEPLAMQRNGGNSYYDADGLGSITALTSSTGSVANTYTYDSFGNLTNFTGTLRNPFLFTGREYDNETSLYFNRARYYNPQNGRFISEDPIRFIGGANFYRYAYNDPANLIDPLGLCDSEPANNGPVVLKNPCQVQGRALSPRAYAQAGQAALANQINFYLDVAMGWPRGGYLDPQKLASGTIYQNQAYGNYAFGVYMQAAGFSLYQTLYDANSYAAYSKLRNWKQYSGNQMDPNYSFLPAASVANITNGYNAQANGTVCHN